MIFKNTQEITKTPIHSQKEWEKCKKSFPGMNENPIEFPCIHTQYTEINEDGYGDYETTCHHCFIYLKDFNCTNTTMKTRHENLELISKLPPEIIEAFAQIIETADVQGDYTHRNDDDRVWEDDVNHTLSELAKEIRQTQGTPANNFMYMVIENHPDHEIIGLYKNEDNAKFLMNSENDRCKHNATYIQPIVIQD